MVMADKENSEKPARKQINVTPVPALKSIYERLYAHGLSNTRLTLAGFLWVLQHPECRQDALRELVEFEAKHTELKPDEVERWIEDKVIAGVVTQAVQEGRQQRPKQKNGRSQKKAAGKHQ